MTEQTGAAPLPLTVPAQPAFPGWDTTALSAFRRANETYIEACLGWHREITGFMQTRLTADIEAQRGVSKCRDWQEIAEVQQDWAASAVRDCFDITARLMRLASGAVNGTGALGAQLKPEPRR